MRRLVLLFVLPISLFAVQCGEGGSDVRVFTKADDDLLFDRITGEWRSRDESGSVASLTLCEDRSSRMSYCAFSECRCHEMRGGGRGIDEEIAPTGGCDCVSGAYGGALKGTLENSDGESHLLEGQMTSTAASSGTPRMSLYDPPYRIDLQPPLAARQRLEIQAIWDGQTLSVTGILPPLREPHDSGPGGDGRLPAFAFVDASKGMDRVLRADASRRFEKVRTRDEACP